MEDEVVDIVIEVGSSHPALNQGKSCRDGVAGVLPDISLRNHERGMGDFEIKT
jgi:hypothetical protein